MKYLPWILGPLAAAFLFSATTPASAAIVTIDTSSNEFRSGLENQGWWPPTIGYSNNTESDYHFVGWSTPGYSDTEVRSFFSFYLDPALLANSTITGASFIIRKGESGGDATQETIGLFDVTSPLATVMHNVSSNFPVWTDLGTGTSYGTYTFPIGGNPDENLFIPLDSAAIAAMNAQFGSYFTMGAAITSGDGFIFRQNPGALGIQALALEITPVPEPSTIALFVFALGILAFCRASRQGKAVALRYQVGPSGRALGWCAPPQIVVAFQSREDPSTYWMPQ